ncbi:MAG: helix-hairpin-helix domain-containing protein [Pseudomonadales bacterium]|nr:helix-hairpin-helix domain-containing protein [Pseudomonadales bacterium]
MNLRHLYLATALVTFGSIGAAAPASAEPVNLNTADAAALDQALVGIGAEKAKAIVAYRQQHGPFKSIDELALVKGVGPKMIERNRANMRVDGGHLRAAPTKPAVPAKTPIVRKSPPGAVRSPAGGRSPD